MAFRNNKPQNLEEDNILNTQGTENMFQRDFDILEGHPAHNSNDDEEEERYGVNTIKKSFIYILIGFAMVVWQVVINILMGKHILSRGYGFILSALMIPVVAAVILAITKKKRY